MLLTLLVKITTVKIEFDSLVLSCFIFPPFLFPSELTLFSPALFSWVTSATVHFSYIKIPNLVFGAMVTSRDKGHLIEHSVLCKFSILGYLTLPSTSGVSTHPKT